MHPDPIYITQPFLPPLEEFHKYLNEIWESNRLTNKAKFHQEFEKSFKINFSVGKA